MQTAMMGDIEAFYRSFGRLIRLHRQRLNLTQEKLGQRVGLSRTSITNIEMGRQHILVHQMLAFARVLQVPPEALLSSASGITSPSDAAFELPAGTEREIREWATKLIPK